MTDVEFFRSTMQSEIEHCRRDMARWGSPEMVASYTDLEPNDFGFMGTALMHAMGLALLAMPMTDWERFYRGYVQWTKERPKNVMKDHEEENARGAMLMALKQQYETQKALVKQKAA